MLVIRHAAHSCVSRVSAPPYPHLSPLCNTITPLPSFPSSHSPIHSPPPSYKQSKWELNWRLRVHGHFPQRIHDTWPRGEGTRGRTPLRLGSCFMWHQALRENTPRDMSVEKALFGRCMRREMLLKGLHEQAFFGRACEEKQYSLCGLDRTEDLGQPKGKDVWALMELPVNLLTTTKTKAIHEHGRNETKRLRWIMVKVLKK